MQIKLSSNQISTAIGSYLLHITAGITTIWGSTNVYYLSYFHYRDRSIDGNTNSIILISVIIPLSIILVLSNKVCDKLGYTKTIKLCAIIFFFSQLIMYIKFSLILFTIFTLLIPVSCITISLIPTLNLLWSHFLNKKSICTAVNLVFLGLGTILWNIVFVALVNPDNEEAQIDQNSNAYFSLKVASKVEDATKVIMFICSIIFLIGAHLIQQIDVQSLPQPHRPPNVQMQIKVDNKIEEQHDQIKNKPTCERSILVNKGSQEVIQQYRRTQPDNNQIIEKQKHSTNLSLTEALKDQRCWLIFLLLIVIDVYPIYLLNNFKVIFMPIFNDDHFLVVCITINTISNILGTFLWGYLAHKFGNITTVSIVVSLTLVGGIIGFFSKNHIIIIIFIIFFGIGDRGMETIAGPALVEIFGLRTATLLLPYKGLSLIIGFLLAPVFQLITSTYFNSFQQLSFLFIFCVISFIIGLYYTLKFRYIDLNSSEMAQKSTNGDKMNKDEIQGYVKFDGDFHIQSKIAQN